MPPISLKDIPKEDDDKTGPELKMNIFLKKVQEVEDREAQEAQQEEEVKEIEGGIEDYISTNTSVTEA